jgi:hypothetical protein
MVEKDEFTLSRKINEHLDEGFELYGSPFAVIEKPSSNSVALILYCQAVIKK